MDNCGDPKVMATATNKNKEHVSQQVCQLAWVKKNNNKVLIVFLTPSTWSFAINLGKLGLMGNSDNSKVTATATN